MATKNPCAHCTELNTLTPTPMPSTFRPAETRRYLLCFRCKQSADVDGQLPVLPFMLERPFRFSSEGWRLSKAILADIERTIR